MIPLKSIRRISIMLIEPSIIERKTRWIEILKEFFESKEPYQNFNRVFESTENWSKIECKGVNHYNISHKITIL
jgi:hypothetical protein